MAMSRSYVFTGNNYTDANIQFLAELDVPYVGYAKEVGANGTPHLQGLLIMKNRCRYATVRNSLPIGFHVEKMRGTAKEARDYFADNPEKPDPDVTERGEIPQQKQGARNDLYGAVQAIMEGESTRNLAEQFGNSYIRYKRHCEEVARCIKADDYKKSCKEKYENAKLRNWQVEATERLHKQGDRKILFVVDLYGNQGKSWLSNYLRSTCNCQSFTMSAGKDVSHALKEPDIVIFDFPRESTDTVNWATIEHVKNGVIFSPKYESALKEWAPPSVAVFMNEMPPMGKFSQDRYDIMVLQPEEYDAELSDKYFTAEQKPADHDEVDAPRETSTPKVNVLYTDFTDAELDCISTNITVADIHTEMPSSTTIIPAFQPPPPQGEEVPVRRRLFVIPEAEALGISAIDR